MSPGRTLFYWRTERDSNPRTAINRYTLSRRAPSTTRPSVRAREWGDTRAGLSLQVLKKPDHSEAEKDCEKHAPGMFFVLAHARLARRRYAALPTLAPKIGCRRFCRTHERL